MHITFHDEPYFRRKEDRLKTRLHNLQGIRLMGEIFLLMSGPVIMVFLSIGLGLNVKKSPVVPIPTTDSGVSQIQVNKKGFPQIARSDRTVKKSEKLSIPKQIPVMKEVPPPASWYGLKEVLVTGKNTKEVKGQFVEARNNLAQTCQDTLHGVFVPVGSAQVSWNKNIIENSNGYQMRQTFECSTKSSS